MAHDVLHVKQAMNVEILLQDLRNVGMGITHTMAQMQHVHLALEDHTAQLLLTCRYLVQVVHIQTTEQ